MIKKRILSMILVFALVLQLCGTVAFAVEETGEIGVESGEAEVTEPEITEEGGTTTGNDVVAEPAPENSGGASAENSEVVAPEVEAGISWSVSNGVLTISGTGAMQDYEYVYSEDGLSDGVNTPWIGYADSITSVVVEDGVTTVGNYAFYGLNNLVSANIANSVESIGEHSFDSCRSLVNVELSDSVKTIDDYAFWFTAVDEIAMPAALESVGEYAFAYTNLSELYLSATNLSFIGIGAFADCSSLSKIELSSCLTEISASAFNAVPVSEITFPSTLAKLGDGVFWNCTELITITFTGSAPTFGENVFYGVPGTEVATAATVYYPDDSNWNSVANQNYGGNLAWVAVESDTSGGETGGENVGGEDSGESEDVDPSGTCGDGLIWWINSLGTLIITGEGTMADYSESESAPWAKYVDQITSVVIQTGVTAVGNYAFDGCDAISAVYFYGDAPTLSSKAFSGVTAECFYPTGWESDALQSCGGTLTWNEINDAGEVLSSVYTGTCGESVEWKLDDGVLTVSGSGAMADFEKNAAVGGSTAPWNDYRDSITAVVIEEGVTSIGAWAFYYCLNLTDVTIADNVASIGDYAFRLCIKLTKVTIPDDVKSIGAWAFGNCTALSEISINGGTYLGNSAFADSGLKTIVFEGYTASSKPIYDEGNEPFAGVTANAWYPAGKGWTEDYYSGFGGDLTWGTQGTCGEDLTWVLAGGTLTISGAGAMGDYSMDSSTGAISTPWYSYSSDVTSVVIESGVTSIGDRAFYNLSDLTSVSISDTVTAIGEYAFYSCGLTSLVIPDSVTVIEANVFVSCNKMTSLTISSKLTAIPENAFHGCSSLTSVTIPAGVTSIEGNAFGSCNGLKTVVFEGDAPTFNSLSFYGVTAAVSYPAGNDTWTDAVMQGYGGTLLWVSDDRTVTASGTCGAVTSVDPKGEKVKWVLTDDGVLTVFGNGTMSDYENGKAPWTAERASITTVVIEEGVTAIGEYAFNGCSNLANVTIPYGVETIGVYAFGGCALTEIIIPYGVTEIGNYVFAYSTKLAKVIFEGDAPVIGDRAFFGVTATTCYYPAGAEGWYDVVNAENNPYGGSLTWYGIDGFCGADTDGDGVPGTNLCWTLTEESEYDATGECVDSWLNLTIFGSGAMMDYNMMSEEMVLPPWYDLGHIRTVTLPEGLTTIGDFAFYSCYGLSEVVEIPSTVKTIGVGAFYGAYSNWDEVEDPTLLTITIPASVESIGMMAFASPLVEAFDVETDNLHYCDVDGVLFTRTEYSTLPVSLAQYPFAKAGAEYVIPDGVTTIDVYAFANPDGQLSRVTVPVSMETIEPFSFAGGNISWINFLGDAPTFGNEAYGEMGGFVFYGDYLLCTYPAGASGWCEATMNGTENATYGAEEVLWKEVTKEIIDSGYCGVVSEEYPYGENLMWTLTSDGTLTITGSGEMCAEKTEGDGQSVWSKYYWPAVLNVSLPEGLTSLDVGAFKDCVYLESITIPSTVTNIGDYAFSGCSALTEIVIPAAVTTLGEYAFANCYGLTEITIQNGLSSIGSYAFYYCSALTEISIPGSVTSVGEYALANCTKLETVDLGDGITVIGSHMFHYCYALTEVSIPDGVTEIGTYAFGHCRALTEIILPDSVTTIGTYAFSGCDNLAAVTLPSGITEISAYTFNYCYELTKIVIPDSVTTIGDYAFSGCNRLAAVYFGNSVEIIGTYAFWSCDALTVITLPDSVTTIGEKAFYYCENLTLVSFGTELTSLGERAFYGTNLAIIKFTGENVPSTGNYTFYNITATVYYPAGNSAWTSKSSNTHWTYATKLTWVATTDNVAPAFSNAFAKVATDENLLWQIDDKTLTGAEIAEYLDYAALSDIVTLYWTCTEEDITNWYWCAGKELNVDSNDISFGIQHVNVPVAYAAGPAYMLALVDSAGNISWELVDLEFNDVTAPAIAVEESEEEDEKPALLLNGTIKNEEATITWTNASADIGDFMLFLDEDGDGEFDRDTETTLSYTPSALDDGSWSLTLSEDVCKEFKLTTGSKISLLLADGAMNMVVYTVALQSSGDSEKPKVETLKAEPTTAGGETDTIKVEIKVTDNVGVKKVELVRDELINDTLKAWTIDDDDKTEWSDSYSWDVSDLDSGEYTLIVTVEDKAGNKQSKEITVKVDNDAPAVYKLSAEADGEEVKLSWYCGESDVTYTIYRVAVGDDSYEKIGTATDMTFSEKPGQGEYSYYVTATDALGNVSDPCDAVTVLVDTVPPELNLVKEPDKSRVWGTIDFEVSSSDVHGVMSVVMSWTCGESAETTELSGDTATIETANLAEGETLKVSFYAIDRAENQSEPIIRTYTIDNIPEPPTDLTAEVVAEGVSLSWKASSPEDNVDEYVLMRAIVSVDDDGNRTVGDYEKIGTVGKVTLSSVIGAVIMDFVEATFKEAVEKELNAILTGDEGITVGEILENLDGYGLSDAAKAALEAIQCDYLDTNVEFGTTYSYKMLAQGYSGLVSESNEASATFVDETAPVVNAIETLSELGEALFGGDYSEVPFDVDASDAGKGQVDHVELSYTVGDREYKVTFQLPGTYTVDVSDWTSGTYTFSATAYDAYKNASKPFETTITVDNDAPVVNADGIAPAVGTKISGESVQFTVPVVDNTDAAPQITVTYKLGDNTLTVDNGILNTVGLPEGELTVTITAVDACGNSVSQDHTYIVDNVPGTPVELAVTSDGTKLTVSWKDSAEQNAGGFVLQRASDEEFTDNLKEWTFNALTRSAGLSYDDGELVHNTTYYYRIKAVSYDGLTSSAWSDVVSITFLDTVAPVLNSFTASQTVCGSNTKEITLTVNAVDNLNISKIVLTYVKDDEKVVELAVLTDGSSFNWDISELTSGTYTVTATVYDAADNCVSGEVTVTVDKDAPTAPANVKAEGSYEWIRLTWDGDETLVNEGGSYRIERDGETVGTCDALQIYFDDPVTDYAEYTYRVIAVDAAGNEAGSETVTAKKKADTEAPVVYDVWPRTGVTICHDVVIQVSALDNWKVVKVEAGYSLDDGKTVTWFDPVTTDSGNPVAEFKWDVSELSGTATLYFKVTDAAGLVSAERTETVEIMAYGAPDAPAKLTYAAGFKSATVNWTYGDTTLLKQFNVYTVENGEEVLCANIRNDRYTLTGLTAETTVRVYAEDIYGAISDKAEIVVTPELTETVAPVAVIQPVELTGVAGSPVKFYGGNSTDNDAIKSWQWTFHDGTTVAAATAEKTYSAAGTYQVTLTVTDNSGNSASVTDTVTIYDVTGEDATHTVLTVTVNDSVTVGTPALENVTVTVTNEDGFETSALTDSGGKAVLVVPQGECTLTAIKQGYAGAVRKIEVTSDDDGCAYQSLSLARGGVSALSGTLTAERMTYEEIKEAGIDVTNPANNHVVKQEFMLRFVPTVELAFDIPVTNYVNAGGQCVGGSNLGWNTYRKSGEGIQPDPGPGGGEIIPEDTVTVGIFPVGKSYYLVIYGETHWLKEMFHVELILVNNSYEEDVKDCIATLNLPEGLSLAAMLDYGQSTRVSIGDIERAVVDAETGTTVFDQEQVSWYVRGDVMGEYMLSADVIGNFVNDANEKTPIDMTFETTSPIKVYAGSALHLTITAQDTAYSEQEYRVQFKLKNVSDITLYNLSFGLTGAEQYSCIIWSDGTETRFEDLDKEDFGDKMTFRVPEFGPGQCITINFVTTCLFEADLASALVDKVTFSTMEVAFRLTDVFVTTLEGSTTDIPTDVVLEPVPKATFTEWLWGEIKDAVKDGVKDAVLQGIDALFFGGVPVAQYGVKVFEVGSDLLEDTKANSKAVVAISDGAYFLDSDNVIHTSGGATVDPTALYSLRRNAGGVAVYTDAEDYTISDDGKTMTINGEGNLYVLRTGATMGVDAEGKEIEIFPEISVTTEYLVNNPDYDSSYDPETDPDYDPTTDAIKTQQYLEKTFTRVLKGDVKVDENGDVVTDAEGNPVLQGYSADLITAVDVALFAPANGTMEVPEAGEELSVTFPHFMTDGNGGITTAASNVTWNLTDADGNVYADDNADGMIAIDGMSLVDGVLTVNSMATGGTYTVALVMTNSEGAAVKTEEQTITLKKVPAGDFACWDPNTGVTYDSLADALAAAEDGDTVQLLADAYDVDVLMVPAGVSLDLNGYYIVSENILSFGDVIDTATIAGGIVISNDRTKAFVQLQQSNNYVPLYDVDCGCYRFYSYTLSLLSYKNPDANSVQFRVRLRLASKEAYELLADDANGGLEMSFVITWTGLSSESVTYTLTGETLTKYAEAALEQINSGARTAMTITTTVELTLSGVNALGSGTIMEVKPTVTSETGVMRSRDPLANYTIYTVS